MRDHEARKQIYALTTRVLALESVVSWHSDRIAFYREYMAALMESLNLEFISSGPTPRQITVKPVKKR